MGAFTYDVCSNLGDTKADGGGGFGAEPYWRQQRSSIKNRSLKRKLSNS